MPACTPVRFPDVPCAEVTDDGHLGLWVELRCLFRKFSSSCTVRAVHKNCGVALTPMRSVPVTAACVLAVVLGGCSPRAAPVSFAVTTAEPASSSRPTSGTEVRFYDLVDALSWTTHASVSGVLTIGDTRTTIVGDYVVARGDWSSTLSVVLGGALVSRTISRVGRTTYARVSDGPWVTDTDVRTATSPLVAFFDTLRQAISRRISPLRDSGLEQVAGRRLHHLRAEYHLQDASGASVVSAGGTDAALFPSYLLPPTDPAMGPLSIDTWRQTLDLWVDGAGAPTTMRVTLSGDAHPLDGAFVSSSITLTYAFDQTSAGITVAPPAIVAENLHAGSLGWRMDGIGYQIATDLGAQIKGYASETSVDAGQPITLFASVSPAQRLMIDIYRLGWYGGTGGRLMVSGAWLPGITQEPCPTEAGLRSCDWLPTMTFTVPTTWVSGIYLAVLTNEHHFQNAVQFVVRGDASTAPLLYVEPVTTYQAYNTWPQDGTGRSLYATAKVSFDRPYANNGTGRSFLDFEQPFIAWLERAGYDVTYATSIDLHRQGAALLLPHRVMLTVGHDEYWTAGMKAAATTAVANGVSLAFFSANNIYWQARLESAPDGQSERVLVCYRYATLDPEPSPALKTVRWRDAPVSQPELTMLGAEYTNVVGGRSAWVVAGDGSWVYRGTGLSNGQSIPDLVWGESDRPPPPTAGTAPTAAVLSDSPFQTRYGGLDRSQAALHQAPSGAWVFNASTFGWSNAINPFGRPDPGVERMTANLLDRMSMAPLSRSDRGPGFARRDEP